MVAERVPYSGGLVSGTSLWIGVVNRNVILEPFGTAISGHNYRGYGIVMDGGRDRGAAEKIQVGPCPAVPPPLLCIFTGLGSDTVRFENHLLLRFPPISSSFQLSNRILAENFGLEFLESASSNCSQAESDIQVRSAAKTALQVIILK